MDNYDDLKKELKNCKNKNELCFLEVKCSISSRSNLGRPTTTQIQNKNAFLETLFKFD